MSLDETTTPQYIITTPSEVDADEERDDEGTSNAEGGDKSVIAMKSISQSTRSQSLQSSSSSTVVEQSNQAISHQTKAQSSTSIVTTERTIQKTSSKSKFQSFLQHPENAHTTSSGSFLTAHQKHVRQFVRSTSAHSAETASAGAAGNRPDKCIRSSSTQIEEPETISEQFSNSTLKTGFHQSSILISKSAETIETKTSSSGIRTQLTLSGGFLAPPNRKLTILSPIHAPPGLHDMLKRHGRSPMSPRISFPGSESDLFGSFSTSESMHSGISETYYKDKIYFPKLHEHVQLVIHNYRKYREVKYDRRPIQPKYYLTETPTGKNGMIHLDI